jgi:hypothetical protein
MEEVGVDEIGLEDKWEENSILIIENSLFSLLLHPTSWVR